MSEINYGHFQDTASRMIARWGMVAAIRRNGTDYACKCVILNYTPQERQGDLINLTDRKALISIEGLTIEPNKDSDVLVTYRQPIATTPVVDKVLKIVSPPGRIDMAGAVVFWRLQVRQ